MFMIHGGVFTDMSFERVVDGTQECYGPFETREQAVTVWRGKMGVNVDTCEHRLFIYEIDEPVLRRHHKLYRDLVAKLDA